MRWPRGGSAVVPIATGSLAGRASETQPCEIAGVAHDFRRAIEESLEIAVLARLHQAEMPLRKREPGVARHAAEDRELRQRRPRRRGEDRAVSRAADAVEDHAGENDVLPVPREALEQRRDGCALARRIHHQHHRPAEPRRELGGRSGLAGADAVEESHGAFAEHQRAGALQRCARFASSAGRIAQAVEIEAGRAGGRRMKGGIDVVGPDLGRDDLPCRDGGAPAAAPGSTSSCRCRTAVPRG